MVRASSRSIATPQLHPLRPSRPLREPINPMPFLELTNVTKGFGGPPILSDVNLAIERGEFVAIVGYSGSGKTTLISMIAGLTKPDHGTVKLNDLEITAPGPDRGIVFQNYSLLPWLTV